MLHRLVHGLMTQEIGPHLSRQDWPAYRDALLARFANPELKHSVHQIATDGSKKILPRWVPPVLDLLQHGQPFDRLAFAAAAWMRCRASFRAPRASQRLPLAAMLASVPIKKLRRRGANQET